MSRWAVGRFGREPARDEASRPAPLGWRAAVSGAWGVVRHRPGLVAVGLLGFLARGGALLFVLPIVVLPTPTGLSNFIGSQALTAGGPSEGLVWLIATALAGVAALILVGTMIGAAVDLRLLREAAAFRGTPAAWRVPVLAPTVLLRVTLVRLVWMLPVAIASVWGAARLVDAAYHQLILPDDLTVPLAIRVLRDAADAAAVVAGTWLLSETFAGLAVRHLILSGGSILGALAWALAVPIRRPLTTVSTLVLGTAGLVAAVGPPLLVANVLWRRLQVLLDGSESPSVTFLATASFVAAWTLGLVLVGWLTTWRSLAWSFEVLRAGGRSQVTARMERPVDPPSVDRSSRDQPLPSGGRAG